MPSAVRNTIIAESLDYCATTLEEATGGDPSKLNAALQKLLTNIMKEHGAIVFNGDGYSDVIVALPGSAGTSSEVRLAVRYGRPLVAFLGEAGEIPELADGVVVCRSLDCVQRFVDGRLAGRREG